MKKSRDSTGGGEPSHSNTLYVGLNDESIDTDRSNPNRSNLSLSSDCQPTFKPITTTLMIVANITIGLLITVGVCLLHLICDNNTSCGVGGGFAIAVYAKVVFWFMQLFIDKYYHHAHTANRRHGYLAFYRSTRTIRSCPRVILASGTSLFLVLTVVMEIYCYPVKNIQPPNMAIVCPSLPIDRLTAAQVLVAVEFAILASVLIFYLVRVVKFNQLAPLPDIFLEEALTSFVQSQMSYTTEVGVRDCDHVDEVIEKQSDLIRYLRAHNRYLGQRLFRLTSQIQANSYSLSTNA